jgi:hypothetical protein
MPTDRAGRRGSAGGPTGRRILRFLVSDRGLLLVVVVLGLAWFAGLLWF